MNGLAMRPPPEPVAMRRVPRCGKCKAKASVLIETGYQTMRFDVLADGTRDAEGWHNAGSVIRLDAECPNGHRWRVRGAVQVTCLDAK